MATEQEPFWARLAIDETLPLDLAETLTPRSLARYLAEPRAGAVEVPDRFPSLPQISLAIPIELRDGAAGGEASANADYHVTGVLGEGGMGRVLLARQRSLQRDVAVKVLKECSTDEEILGGLLSEALITGSLEHPGIVPVHALGYDDEGRPVLVMKRIEGVSWRDLAVDERHAAWAMLDATGADRLTAHLEILMQACNALHFAHRRGVVHRDVKPANVMIGSYGEVYVVDWGIAARIPGEGGAAPVEGGNVALVGTPAYMAPEMVWGDALRVDARTDVYLLGAALHDVLTGKPRHAGGNLLEMMLAARASAPYPYGPEVPAELATICNRATHVDPAQRFPSALALRRAVTEYLRHQGSIALGEAAAKQLRELHDIVAPGTTGRVEDQRRLHRLMTECRHGFMQALRAWKDNPAARMGLGECLEVMIRHELERRDREGAAALLADLPEPRPDLEALLAALDAELAARRERDVRLGKMEREHDPAAGAGARLLLLAVIGALAVTLSIAAAWLGSEHVGHRELIVFMLVVTGTLYPVIALARKRFFATQVGRIAAGATLVWATATLTERLLAARFGVRVQQSIVLELVQTTSLLAATSITLPRGFWWAPIVNASAVVAAVLWPDLTIPIYAGSGVLVCGILGFFGYRMIK